MSSFGEQDLINTTLLPHPHLSHNIHQELITANHETSCVDQSSKITNNSDTEVSVVKNQSPESSMVVDKLENGEQVTQKVIPMEKKRRTRNGSSSLNSPLFKVTKLELFM